MSYKLLRLPQVKEECGLARSTIYLRVSQGLLTQPVSLGYRSVGWPQSEIEENNAARIAGNSDDEVRQLVASLQSARKERALI